MLVLLKIVYGRGPGVGCGGEGRPGETGVLSAYIIEAYKDVQKYGVGFSTQIINMGVVCKQEW